MSASRTPRERKCPCGSGLPRSRCDQRVLVPCIEDGCTNLFHLTCNRAKRCPTCRPKRERAMDAAKHRRARRRRATADAGQQLELGGET